ncbi:heme peroxidase [Echria macrotheca]|uniref:Heme peroxidase n=1 Tax=Echria macrotheca TaxID=438768 RepID=A0AAJ0B3B9_9PEZI|nr:heme peroxidase [Echria macrotheca]
MDDQRMLFQPSLTDRISVGTFHFINKYVPWHKLPAVFGALNLSALRVELRGYNLHDGYASATPVQGSPETEPLPDSRYLDARHSDGKFNSLEMPRMGCVGMRFGRNFPREHCHRPSNEMLMTPNPRIVSERFMARKKPDGFIPATTLNLLAAAWIQFQTHDWFNHELSKETIDVTMPEGETWDKRPVMTIPRTQPDDVLDPSDVKCPGYRNMNTAWWDGSQIYGSSEEITSKLRTKLPDGKLELIKYGEDYFLPTETDGLPRTGFNNNWWIGLELLHTLFALEHNSICDMIKKAYPTWSGDKIFDIARLVNCALMAKIHTVEWTPAILAHPALQVGMNANWWGLAGETLTKMVGRISKTSEVISGIPGSGANQDGIPYSMTEEFVSVYRMHPLIPDTIAFFDAKSGNHKITSTVLSTTFDGSRSPFKDGHLTFADTLYSFGINYPGAITNHNYPDFLRDLTTPGDHLHRDLGTIDILRDRERGVPRYCAFRRMLRMSVPKTFLELTGGNAPLAEELAEVYNNDIELVDALVGSHSEPVIPGFGFSETAFRIFIVMASRRLQSDRFIATQWNAETYTKEGFRWVQHTTMKDVLVRHFPELKETLGKSKNVFAPWAKLDGSKGYEGIETNAPKKK